MTRWPPDMKIMASGQIHIVFCDHDTVKHLLGANSGPVVVFRQCYTSQISTAVEAVLAP